MILRDATDQDAAATGAILSEFIHTTPWMPVLHSPDDIEGFCRMMIAKGWVKVAESSAGVVGFIARNETEVNALYIAGDSREQGIGAALIHDAQAQTKNLQLWTFEENLGARRFYAGHGFVEIARTDGASNDEKLPDVRLEWRSEG